MTYTEPNPEENPPQEEPEQEEEEPETRAATTMYAPNQQAVRADGSGPAAVHSTTGVAGTPGSWTPADSIPPFSFNDLSRGWPFTRTASPATNWTTGQRVVLGDGSLANWNGTAWVAGTHA